MKVHFADVIAEVHEFRYKEIYGGLIEGTCAFRSKSLLEDLIRKANEHKGHMVLESFKDDRKEELKDFQYYIFAKTDYEHRIFITWFDDAMREDITITEVIEKVTRNISFKENCQVIDLKELF